MARDHALMYVLSAIILLNIVAILLLQNRLAEKEVRIVQETPASAASNPPVEPVVIRPDRPDVRTIVLPASCNDCYNISNYLVLLNDTIDMQVEKVSDRDASLFHARRLPAIAFNASIEQYPALVIGWEQVGSIVNISSGEYAGTWYVLPTQNAPFEENGTIYGRVQATYLMMESCNGCYDADVLRRELLNVGITPYSERTIDAESAEGKQLIQKYNITAVPTLLMNADAKYYPLQPGWNVVGTVEPDGTFVLRDLQRMKVTYYDLAHKKLMKP